MKPIGASARASSGSQKLTCTLESLLSSHIEESARPMRLMRPARSCPGIVRNRRPVCGVKGTPDHQLGKIADAGLLGCIGPSVIEDELAHAVGFEIERACGDDAFLGTFANDQMIGGPSGLPRCGAGMFHRVEPVVFEERGIVGREQAVPCVARDFFDSFDDGDVEAWRCVVHLKFKSFIANLLFA